MNKYSKLVAILTVLAVALGTAVLLFTMNTKEEKPLEFPQRVTHRVMLNLEDKEIESHIEYYRDATTRVVAAIKYRNGYIRVKHYHPDRQTVTRVQDFYSESPELEPLLVADSYLMEDGQNLSKHTVYRLDGTLDREGNRLEDGKYKTAYYSTDGVTVLAEKVYEIGEVVHSERGFYDDGSVKFSTEWTNAYLTTKFFRLDGSVESIIENHYAFQRGVFLEEDGKTARAAFTRGEERLEVIFLNANGVAEYVVQTAPNAITVTALDGDNYLYEQSFRPDEFSKASYCSASNKLTKVSVFDERSRRPFMRTVARTFYLSADGTYPEKMVVPYGTPMDIVYKLDKQGVVLDVEIQPAPGREAKEVTPDYEVGDRVDIDHTMFQPKDFECFQFPERLEVPQIRTFRR